LWWLGFLL